MHFVNDDFEEEKGAVHLLSTLKKSIPYLKQEKWSFVLALVFLVFMSIFSLALPLILKNIIDLALPQKDIQLLLVLTAVYLVIFVLYLVLNFCQVFMLTKVGVRIVTKVKTELFDKLLTFDLGFFQRYTVGRLLSRVESDGENIKQLFSLVTVNILQSSLMFLGILGVLFYTSPKITGFVLLLVPICFISTYVVLKKLKVLFKKSRRFHANITSVVTELLQFVDVIQIFRYKKGALDKLKVVNRQKFVNDAKAHFGEQGFWGFFMFFEIAAISIVLFVGAGQFIQGTMTIGTLVMFIEFIRRLFYPILQLSQYLNEVQKGVVSAERMFGLMEEKPQVFDPVQIDCHPVLNQSLVFKNVSFSYQLPQLVLQNIERTSSAL